VLKLWRLCGNASCRRTRCCRGRVRLCFPRNFPLLPDGVRGWVDALAGAKADGLSFEEAMEWLDGMEEGCAFAAWNAAVAVPVMSYSPLLSKG
jgi:hypothetical protein